MEGSRQMAWRDIMRFPGGRAYAILAFRRDIGHKKSAGAS
jgi:hypothetical protein